MIFDKAKRHASLSRSESSYSLEGKKRKTVNKKHLELNN